MKIRFKGLFLFYFILFLYFLLYIFNSDKVIISLIKSFNILIEILPIFVIIILLTAIINFFVNPKVISKHIGENSGTKGWVIAIIAGIISHGPMYVWYPMFLEFKKHGLKDGLIATFFYSRAVKLPLLPMMISYFGWFFTIILTVFILIASLLQGLIIDKILNINK